MTKFADPVLEKARELIGLELWNQAAVAINVSQPFRLASGNYSPIYIDCRRLLRSPALGDFFSGTSKLIFEHRQIRFDVIAGGETAGIPFAAFIARSVNAPLIYVRKSSKTHGTRSRIEGHLNAGERVLLVEDLITDAGSKVDFIRAILDAGAAVSDVLVILDRLQGGAEALSAMNIHLHAITDINRVLDQGLAAGVYSSQIFASVRNYLSNVEDWHSQMSLPYQKRR